jgi:hypothetical protein
MKRIASSARLVVMLAVAGVFGCRDSAFEPSTRDVPAAEELPLAEEVSVDGRTERRLALVHPNNGDTVLVEAPARSRAGSAFEVHVTTFGGLVGRCVGRDTTVAVVVGLRASVYPYQRIPTDPNTICTAVKIRERRTVRLVFESAGDATLRIVGRQSSGLFWVLERRVVVE